MKSIFQVPLALLNCFPSQWQDLNEPGWLFSGFLTTQEKQIPLTSIFISFEILKVLFHLVIF